MMLRKLILTTAAAALLAAPLAAHAAPVRATSPVDEGENLNQQVGFLLGASVLAVLILLFAGDHDTPSSP